MARSARPKATSCVDIGWLYHMPACRHTGKTVDVYSSAHEQTARTCKECEAARAGAGHATGVSDGREASWRGSVLHYRHVLDGLRQAKWVGHKQVGRMHVVAVRTKTSQGDTLLMCMEMEDGRLVNPCQQPHLHARCATAQELRHAALLPAACDHCKAGKGNQRGSAAGAATPAGGSMHIFTPTDELLHAESLDLHSLSRGSSAPHLAAEGSPVAKPRNLQPTGHRQTAVRASLSASSTAGRSF